MTTFAEPFEMLSACHERITRMLSLLERLRAHLRTHGNDAQARQAARDVMRYFDLAAPQHHLDEELHVFPPILSRGDPALVALVRRLQQDHREMEAGWAAARPVLDAIAQGGPGQPDAAGAATLDAFAALHADHLAAEEDRVYPAAQAGLEPGALAAMTSEMMKRRGVS
ncbi:hemerythrin domain-containing protein [Ramlibacter sp. XY19]|uniref:hemerythrin domain-containing protein n=1 Tax=Ramlibacter paludis TaxID=2908000 RepID=UPI0023DA84F6|nr:hemerythrin domain-containing protein [Ramlibacter paludis]MCG2592770.1 hemerythrin domain-containing protein [Ramlibacter paludis]